MTPKERLKKDIEATMHTEKQEIFDKYAKSNGYINWVSLQIHHNNRSLDYDDHIFAACDLVQQEQQKRIAENAKIQQTSCGDAMTCGCMGRCDYPISYVNKRSILNPENRIH